MTIPPLLSSLYALVVTGKEKAVVAFVVTGAATLLAQHFGVHASSGLQQALTSVLLALLAHVGVYITQNHE